MMIAIPYLLEYPSNMPVSVICLALSAAVPENKSLYRGRSCNFQYAGDREI